MREENGPWNGLIFLLVLIALVMYVNKQDDTTKPKTQAAASWDYELVCLPARDKALCVAKIRYEKVRNLFSVTPEMSVEDFCTEPFCSSLQTVFCPPISHT